MSDKCKIMIVDDSKFNILFLTNTLSELYDVVSVENGNDALILLETIDPDIILLDVVMEGIDGYEVCKRIKAIKKHRDTPVIFLTAKDEVNDEYRGFEVGGVDYITKPVKVQILLARICIHIQLCKEKKKSEQLIRNILPPSIVDELKTHGKIEPVLYEKAAVLFSDLADFTRLSSKMKPVELIGELNDLFTVFDDIIENNSCERIKTIGDAYMAVSGLPLKNELYADNIVRTSIDMTNYLKERAKLGAYPWNSRIGIDAGEVVGGIVGTKKLYMMCLVRPLTWLQD